MNCPWQNSKTCVLPHGRCEIVILITPRIVDYAQINPEKASIRRTEFINQIIDAEPKGTGQNLEQVFDANESNSYQQSAERENR